MAIAFAEPRNLVLFLNGRSALYSILKAIGVGAGDEVILQAFTCLAVPLPILYLNASPVYVDIDPETLCMETADMERKITPKTRAIIVQHTYGKLADLRAVCRIAEKHNIAIIEDCCHRFDFHYSPSEMAPVRHFAFFSFEWGKQIVAGYGGCATTGHQTLLQSIEDVRSQLAVCPPLKRGSLRLLNLLHRIVLRPAIFWQIRSLYRWASSVGLLKGTFSDSELSGQMTSSLFSLSKSQEKRIRKKIKLSASAQKHRAGVQTFYFNFPIVNESCIYQNPPDLLMRLPIRVKNKPFLLEQARKEGIELGDWYVTPVHPLKRHQLESIGYIAGSCPHSEKACDEIITLPMHDKISSTHQEKIISFLHRHSQ